VWCLQCHAICIFEAKKKSFVQAGCESEIQTSINKVFSLLVFADFCCRTARSAPGQACTPTAHPTLAFSLSSQTAPLLLYVDGQSKKLADSFPIDWFMFRIKSSATCA
jgi:hypothetical protein